MFRGEHQSTPAREDARAERAEEPWIYQRATPRRPSSAELGDLCQAGGRIRAQRAGERDARCGARRLVAARNTEGAGIRGVLIVAFRA